MIHSVYDSRFVYAFMCVCATNTVKRETTQKKG